jgi:transcriptional regulator with XRE-family HTH domain
MSALGETFRTMRESQGLTLSDVADRIHIRSVYLAAIEAEDWTAIGPPVYVRGFVRSYARCLGLDADAFVARLAEATPTGAAQRLAAAPSVAARPPKAPRVEPVLAPRDRPARPGLSLGAIAGVLVALGLVLFVGYEYLQYSRGESVPVTAATALPAEPIARLSGPRAAARTAALVPRTKTADRSSEFAVQLQDSSWLRVVVDGKVAMEGLYPRGTQRAFNGRSATVRVGNAGGVDIFLDGKDLGPMGGLGDVAERSYQLEAR